MSPSPVTCIAKSNDRLGEGCMWDDQEQALWWLDIPQPSRIHKLDPATGAYRIDEDGRSTKMLGEVGVSNVTCEKF